MTCLALLNQVFDSTHSPGPNRSAYLSKECIDFQKCTEMMIVTAHEVWDQDFITTTGCITTASTSSSLQWWMLSLNPKFNTTLHGNGIGTESSESDKDVVIHPD